MITRDFKFLSATLCVGLFACVSALVVSQNQYHPDLSARPIPPWKPALDAAPNVDKLTTQQLDLDQALRRPLFRQSRLPFDPAAQIIGQQEQLPSLAIVEVVAPPPVDTSQYVLKGILIDAGNQQALIATAEAPEGVWLQKGAELSSWLLSDVKPDRVVLANGTQTVELKLYVDNPSSN